jgi:hypothetical protein
VDATTEEADTLHAHQSVSMDFFNGFPWNKLHSVYVYIWCRENWLKKLIVLGLKKSVETDWCACSDSEERHVTRTEYYAYYLHYRSSHPDTLFHSRKLFHQLIVDFWATTEQNKLQWIETNQSTLRADQ